MPSPTGLLFRDLVLGHEADFEIMSDEQVLFEGTVTKDNIFLDDIEPIHYIEIGAFTIAEYVKAGLSRRLIDGIALSSESIDFMMPLNSPVEITNLNDIQIRLEVPLEELP